MGYSATVNTGPLPDVPMVAAHAFIAAEGQFTVLAHGGIASVTWNGVNLYTIVLLDELDPFRMFPMATLGSAVNGQLDAVVIDGRTLQVRTFDGAGLADERGFYFMLWRF